MSAVSNDTAPAQVVKLENGGYSGDVDSPDNATMAAEFQESARAYLASQTEHVIMPSFSKWFDLASIHSIELKLFPDFFSKSSSPYRSKQSYTDMRNFMVNAYRLNPREYLTVTAVRRNLAGDVTTVIRIHQFLERWGIINYQIDPKTKSAVVGPQYTGHFQITLDTPTGLVPHLPSKDSSSEADPKSGSLVDSPAPFPDSATTLKEDNKLEQDFALNLQVRRNIYSTSSDPGAKKPNAIVQFFCNICGKDATTVRYHNLRIKSYTHNPSSTINNASVLCSLCYDQGLFPLNFLSSDFIKLRKTQESLDWSEQEVLLLLEGIEMFGTFDSPSAHVTIHTNGNEQWEKIAEHVASKNREQCLLKFIELPIEDKFLTRLLKNDDRAPSLSNTNESLVADIVSRVLKEANGPKILAEKADSQAEDSSKTQTQLIQQVLTLTLDTVNEKLKRVDDLYRDLISAENSLNREREQVLADRWNQMERILRLKSERPELALVLDDLLKPSDSDRAQKTVEQVQESKMDVDVENSEAAKEKLPVSVLEPKAYQFWSG